MPKIKQIKQQNKVKRDSALIRIREYINILPSDLSKQHNICHVKSRLTQLPSTWEQFGQVQDRLEKTNDFEEEKIMFKNQFENDYFS